MNRPTLRSYARRGYQAVLSKLPTGLQRRWLYLKSHRRLLHLRRPQTFNEKINWRIVFDRRDLIGMTGDKLRSKEFAASRGVEVPRLLWSGTDIDEFATSWADGTASWVLKPNFSSGDVIFGQGRPDPAKLAPAVRSWMAADRASGTGEWAYGQAERVILAEERLGSPDQPLTDFKFFVFDGHVAGWSGAVGRG